VRLLANPIIVRMALMLFAMALVFFMGVMLMRRMRRRLTAEAVAVDAPASKSSPLHTYHSVIQLLKQQKHELQSQQQEERRRAKTSENISAAVLSNLSSGVMFFTPDGQVRQANAAAKQILGFASPLGVTVAQVFREAAAMPSSGAPGSRLVDAIQSTLHELTPFRRLEAWYVTPAGAGRTLEITLTLVLAPGGEVLGAACLINDLSEIARIRRQQEWREEVSAEMALDLHNSLNTIAGYAQRLAGSSDPELARQVAGDIAVEAAHLDHTVGGFLAGAKAASGAAGQ
jgi:nitrogen fixation/metabolism regulation signal transduction histidine kinase